VAANLNAKFKKKKGKWFLELYRWGIFAFIEESGLAGRVRRRRIFESAECKVCSMKGSTYCWRQCPYNTWRHQQIE